MTVDLKELAAQGVAVELKPGCRYLIFMNAQCVNREDLMRAEYESPFEADVQILFVVPPGGGTVSDCVAAFELEALQRAT